jgi:hypothetical protein
MAKMLNFRCPSDLLEAIDQLGQQRYPADNNNGCDRSKTLIDIIAAGIQVLSDGSIEVPISKTGKTSKTISPEELKLVLKDELLSELQEVVRREMTNVRQEVDERLATLGERLNTREQAEEARDFGVEVNFQVPTERTGTQASASDEDKAKNGNVAPLVDVLIKKLVDSSVTEEEFFQQFRQIVKRCGFNLYRSSAKGKESWYVAPQSNIGFEVIRSMDYLNIIPDWLRRQDLMGE